MKEKYVKILLNLARKASKKNEVPVSAIIIKNDKIMAKAWNKREKKHNVINHAEILAIIKASRKLKDWRLFDCDLYVTLKPCNMCENIIKQSRIKNVYYLMEKQNNKKEYEKTNFIKLNDRQNEQMYDIIIKSFFKKKRDNN